MPANQSSYELSLGSSFFISERSLSHTEMEERVASTSHTSVDDHIWGYLEPRDSRATRIRLWGIGNYIKLGRNREKNDLVLQGVKISDSHCIITWDEREGQEGLATLQDLSLNGTFINRKLVGKNKTSFLRHKDSIQFGSLNPQQTSDGGMMDFHFIYHQCAKGDQPLINETYDIGRELGSGSYGTVRMAKHKGEGKSFAIKTFRKGVLEIGNEQEKKLLMREIGIMYALSHRSICLIREVIVDAPLLSLHIVMEYVKGKDLQKLIARSKKLSEEVSKDILYQIFDGMAYVHSRYVVHRDLKPENILLTDDVPPRVKIADFGLSKLVIGMDRLLTICGSPSHMAPEIVGNKPYDKRVDSFSIGVIMFEMLTGVIPYTLRNELKKPANLKAGIRQRKDSTRLIQTEPISENARNLIMGLLDFDPAKRPSMKEALEHPWFDNFEPFYGMSDWEIDRQTTNAQDDPSSIHNERNEEWRPQSGAVLETVDEEMESAYESQADEDELEENELEDDDLVEGEIREKVESWPVSFILDKDGDSFMGPIPGAFEPRRQFKKIPNPAEGLRRSTRDRKPSWKAAQGRGN